MIAAEQLHGAEAVALGLEDAALLDLAELADGAVAGVEDRAGRAVQRTGAVLQGAGEEGVEMFVGRRLLDLRLAHVDLKMPDEPLDERVLYPGQAAFGQAAGQAGNQVMRQHILADDEQAVFHVCPFIAAPGCQAGCPIRPRNRHSP